MEDGSLVISGLGYTVGFGSLQQNAEGYVKDFTQAGGDRDTELLRTMGGYEEHDIKNTNMFEFTVTAIGSDALFSTMLLGGSHALTTGSAIEKWPRVRYNIFGVWTDSTAISGPQLKISCLSSLVTNVGLKAATADSIEETMTWKCLPKDFRKQFTSNKGSTPIV
jgi:hypothetical protein